MKKLATLILVGAVALLLGCIGQRGLYNAIAATEATVDAGMTSWARYVATIEKQPQTDLVKLQAHIAEVSAAHARYRVAMTLVYELRMTATAKDAELQQRVASAGAALIAVLNTFLPINQQLVTP